MEHPIRAFLDAKGQKQVDFARELGLTPSYLNQLLTGYRYPSRELARRIEQATKGKVKAAALLLWEKPAAPAVSDPPAAA